MTKHDPSVGICYLVGAGPGDIGLVTLRAKECIEEADVIVYDYLSNPEMLRWAKPEAELTKRNSPKCRFPKRWTWLLST